MENDIESIIIPRSLLRDKVNNCIDKYLALSNMQKISVGLYIKGKRYIVSLNDNENELFYDIGSMSKAITAQLILKLFLENNMDINASVSEFLCLKKGNYPTVYQLLTHTAGYKYLTPLEITLPALLRHRYSYRNPYEKITSSEVIKALEKRNKNKESARYSYSDFPYAVLALVAQSLKPQPFNIQLEEFLNNNLNMHSTTVIRKSNLPSAVYNGKIIPFWQWQEENPYIAAGGVVSNVCDMVQYLALQIESNDYYITKSHEVCNNSFKNRKNTGSCIGWHTYKKSNRLWNVGGAGTFRSSIIINKKRKIGVVVLGNTRGVKSANINYIAKMLYGEIRTNKIRI